MYNSIFRFLTRWGNHLLSSEPAVLQLDQIVRQLDNIGNIAGFKLTFTNFKCFYNQRAVSLTLHRCSDVCPVQSLHAYLFCMPIPPPPPPPPLLAKSLVQNFLCETGKVKMAKKNPNKLNMINPERRVENITPSSACSPNTMAVTWNKSEGIKYGHYTIEILR